MKKILLAGVAVAAVAVAAPANAADLRMPVKAAPSVAPAPYFSWTGCYIGAHVGWGWGHKDFGNATSRGSTDFSLNTSFDTSGAMFGGQLGCNYQLQGNWVIGLEGSVSGADINGFSGSAACESSIIHAKTDFLASITGRLGWNGWDPRTLFYIKGGAAWAHDRYLWASESNQHDVQQDRSGWVIGFGVEWAFAPNWSAFAEYDHYDFGTERTCFTCTRGTNLHFDITQQIDTVRLGVNYRFNVGFLGIGKGPLAARY
jgi:outer membrane immunogenic protein